MSVTSHLARLRVPLGFLCGVAALALADPTPQSLIAGSAIAAIGEALRVWAAGHLEKSREVTTSGPYRFTRHPLYLGSGLMAAGFVVAAHNVPVMVLTAGYMAATYFSAITREEAFLTERFGAAYPDYKAGRLGGVARSFSLERAMRNREYRAVIGFVAALAILAVKAGAFR
ncbi:MAG: isoprenylcysteine carboxylmethyltransferase family protein [Acidobacteriota bacterium]|nr:isoprenylcysteine carboxylmethyltransferase family protein [Acidobacteriota bacterium]